MNGRSCFCFLFFLSVIFSFVDNKVSKGRPLFSRSVIVASFVRASYLVTLVSMPGLLIETHSSQSSVIEIFL